MSRVLPADAAAHILPVPADFKPDFEDRGYYIRWTARLDVAGVPTDVELGFSKRGGKVDLPMMNANLRASAWQAMELARLGRADLLRYCIVGRHKRN